MIGRRRGRGKEDRRRDQLPLAPPPAAPSVTTTFACVDCIVKWIVHSWKYVPGFVKVKLKGTLHAGPRERFAPRR
jgi:hypothetical protein